MSREQNGPFGGAAGTMRRTLIVGAGSGGEFIGRELQENPQWQMWPVGYVDDAEVKQRTLIGALPVLGHVAAMPAVVSREGIDVIVLAIPSGTRARREEIARLAVATGAEVVTMPSIGEILTGQRQAASLGAVRITDVLGRPIVQPDHARSFAFVAGRTVMVTGAAGSIGRELAEQVAALGPSRLVVLDMNESDLHDLRHDLAMRHPELDLLAVICSVADEHIMDRMLRMYRPDIVFHAAAYKHVPLMEDYPGEAVRTNVLGTRNVAWSAARYGVKRFVLVSTDKAVRPSSVMGATKRLAEIVLADAGYRTGMSSCSVRFGNVLGSRGSVIPTFERQIRAGGPVTVTDARMRRYFMAIEEAASLIIQAGAFGERDVICMLDMGEDVSILELAERVIALHGLRPHQDIPITFTGMRPGEKLREALANDFEQGRPSPHSKIRMLSGVTHPEALTDLHERLSVLETLARNGSAAALRAALHELINHYDCEVERYGDSAAAPHYNEADHVAIFHDGAAVPALHS